MQTPEGAYKIRLPYGLVPPLQAEKKLTYGFQTTQTAALRPSARPHPHLILGISRQCPVLDFPVIGFCKGLLAGVRGDRDLGADSNFPLCKRDTDSIWSPIAEGHMSANC
jgi:hypothetical protein